MLDARGLALGCLVSALLAGVANAQSFEAENGCATTADDPCERSGSCSIQGADWDQVVTIDRADLFDTMGWPGLCDQVHVGLVRGNCEPGGSQQDVTVLLSATSFAAIPQIVGPLTCEAEPLDPPVVPAASWLGLLVLCATLATLGGLRLRGA